MNIAKLLEKHRVPIASAGLLGSLAGLIISFLDLRYALRKKR